MNPVNSFTFPSNKTATHNHSQSNMLFWLDSLCDNLVYPCNTLTPGGKLVFHIFGAIWGLGIIGTESPIGRKALYGRR